MSFNNSGLNGLNLNTSVIIRPIGKVNLTGTVGTDLIIPENVSDCQMILKNDCEVKVNEIFASNSAVTVRGTLSHTALLLGEDGTLGSVKASEDFELKDFIEGADEASLLVYSGSSCDGNSRLVNPRKLNLSSDVSICVNVMCEQNPVPVIRGTETIDDEVSLKRKQGMVTCIDTYSLSEKAIPVSHDVILDGNFPPMSEIVYCAVKVRPSEIMASGNGITIKAKALFSGIYKSEEGNIFSIEKTFVLEKTLEADNADSYEWSACANVDDVTAEIAIDGYGEAKLIELDFNYDVLINGIRNIDVETVTDAYSTEYECETAALHGESVVYKRAYGSSLSVNASAERNDIAAENVRAVMLGSVNVKDVVSEYSDEKKRLIIEATAIVSAVCENNITSDTDPKYSSLSFAYPFKCELDIGEKLDNTNCDVTISVTDARFRCDQNKIYCDFENDVRAFVSENVPHSYLTEIALDKNAPISAAYAPITLCYPSGGESLWDIAKYYRVTSEEIALSNNLSDEDITDKKVLLIPSYRKTKSAFSNAK